MFIFNLIGLLKCFLYPIFY